MTEQLSEKELRRREREERKRVRVEARRAASNARFQEKWQRKKISREAVANIILREARELWETSDGVDSVEYKIGSAFYNLGSRFEGKR